MKKLLAALFLLAVIASPVFGAGTCTQTLEDIRIDLNREPYQRVLTFTCTADASAATFPSTPIDTAYVTRLKGWYLYKVITNPGGTAPTDNWDFTITDGDGIDVLGGNGANRHTTSSQMIAPLLTTGVYFAQPVLDTWTMAIADGSNLVNSAGIVIKAIFVR